MRKFGMTFWIPLMLLILSGIGFRLSFLQQSIVSQGYRTSKKPNLNGTGFRTEDAALFYALLDSGLITPMPDDRRIALPSPDAILVERADLAKKSDRAATEPDDIGTRERLVRSLYNSYAGFVVQSQVRLWNDAHYFTAVRDDRAKHTNQRDNQWRTYNAASSRSKIRVGKRVPVYFGFVNNGRLRPHFSDWLTAHPDSGPVEFRTRIKLDQETELNVQLVGKPLSIFPQATLKPRCPEIEDCTLDRSTAYSVSYSLPKGDHELRFTALPLLSKELRIPGLKIRRAGIAGKFHWDDLPQKAAPTNNLFKITASDGTLLAAENGTPSDFSEQNGLIPLIGFSRQDTYSLSGIMARSFVPADVFSCRLTIDPEIQHSAQQTLTNMVESFWPEDDYADERRGAVVILDADTGAILAVAGKPLPPRGTHPWDLASFAKTYPLKNPLTVRSWQSLDKHTTPGSTFKTAVAISAIKMSGEKKMLINLWTAGRTVNSKNGPTERGFH